MWLSQTPVVAIGRGFFVLLVAPFVADWPFIGVTNLSLTYLLTEGFSCLWRIGFLGDKEGCTKE